MARRDSDRPGLLRWSSFGLAIVVAVVAMGSDADARSKKKRPVYSPPTASIVVDGNTGAVLHASNADAIRHPASLTKMMTLYMLFERLESGKIKLNTEMPASAHAAGQAPSKVGLKPGDTIKVETAIKALVVKSANDVATVVAEYLGGDEPSFARMMTSKARALGMAHTTYRNANGLPDDDQVTTARDQALLGRALQDRFPNYFRYFNSRSFDYAGRTYRGHNRLLGSVDGVDGIKTGYIRASGFNIVTSVNRNNRHLVAAVFGGRTAAARDAVVRGLIAQTYKVAASKRTAPPVVEGTAVAEIKMPVKPPTPMADPRPADVAAAESPDVGSTSPIKPNPVKTMLVRAGKTPMANLSELTPVGGTLTQPHTRTVTVNTIATVKSDLPPPSDTAPGTLGTLPAKTASSQQVASTSAIVPTPLPAPEPMGSAKTRNGWMIQVGAFPEEKSAKERLSTAQSKAKEQLGEAEPFTEKIAKGDRSLFRARFAGLDRPQAEAACKNLKRSEIPCLLVKN
jgi:D-alanyl-D-alanine carboxypeptidase